MVISATDSRRSNVVGLTLERKRVRTGSHAVDALGGSLVAPSLLQAGVEDVAAGGQPLGEPSSELSNVHVEHLPKSRQIRACPTTVEYQRLGIHGTEDKGTMLAACLWCAPPLSDH